MSQWSFFNAETGLFSPRQVSTNSRLMPKAPPGYVAKEGRFDHLSQKVNVSNGQVVDYQPPQPVATNMHTWEWNASTKRWMAVPTLYAIQEAAIAVLLRGIAVQETEQQRPLRELTRALVMKEKAPQEAVDALDAIEADIEKSRQAIAKIKAETDPAKIPNHAKRQD